MLRTWRRTETSNGSAVWAVVPPDGGEPLRQSMLHRNGEVVGEAHRKDSPAENAASDERLDAEGSEPSADTAHFAGASTSFGHGA